MVISVSLIDLSWGAPIVVHTVHLPESVHQSMILFETVRPKALTVFTENNILTIFYVFQGRKILRTSGKIVIAFCLDLDLYEIVGERG